MIWWLLWLLVVILIWLWVWMRFRSRAAAHRRFVEKMRADDPVAFAAHEAGAAVAHLPLDQRIVALRVALTIAEVEHDAAVRATRMSIDGLIARDVQ